MNRWLVAGALAIAVPAAAQNADWQLDPLPLLQGEWEYWGPEDNRSWGGYAKIRIADRTVTMIDPYHPDYLGSAFSKAPAGATVMTIERWTQDTTTGANQVIIRGTCYDYTNSYGRPGWCWHVLTKMGPMNRNRQGKLVSWQFTDFQRLRDGTTGEAAGYAKEVAPAAPERRETARSQPVSAPLEAGPTEAEREAAEAQRLAAAAERLRQAQARADSQAQAVESRYRADQQRFEAELARVQSEQQRFAEQRANHEIALADADIAKRRYEEELALYYKDGKAAAAAAERRRESEARRQAAEAKRRELETPVEWREGVVVCDPNTPQHKFGNWRCTGPLQMTYAKLDTPQAAVPLGQACGSDRGIRDLGMANGYRLFGCGFGIHPSANMRDVPLHGDPASRMGIGYVADRAIFRCPPKQTNVCRTR